MKRRCPQCKRNYSYASLEAHKPYPFCSERCRVLDLGGWLTEEYRVVRDVAPEEVLNAELGEFQPPREEEPE